MSINHPDSTLAKSFTTEDTDTEPKEHGSQHAYASHGAAARRLRAREPKVKARCRIRRLPCAFGARGRQGRPAVRRARVQQRWNLRYSPWAGSRSIAGEQRSVLAFFGAGGHVRIEALFQHAVTLDSPARTTLGFPEKTMKRLRIVLFIIVAGLIGGIGIGRHSVRAQQPSQAAPAGEWRTYGGDLKSSKYSPLTQLTADNFATMKLAWRWKSADAFLSRTIPGRGEVWASSRVIFDSLNKENPKLWRDQQPPILGNFKATPLMVRGRLFINMPTSIGAAIDAKTGETLWIYNPKSYEAGTTTMSARWNQRGVAYWADGNDERVFWGTGDGYLVAVDAKTGVPVDNFGDHGRVDLMQGLPFAERGKRDWLNALTYSVQSPPIVVRNTVVTPASISSYNNIKEQIPGWTRGWDTRTGKLKWTFHTIPRPGEFGIETWEGDSWSYTGKVSGVVDLQRRRGARLSLHAARHRRAATIYGGHRPGNNLFAESLVCLDAETGKRVWHYQIVHHGLWDYDLPAAPNLLDITVERPADQGGGAGHQAGVRFRVRPRDRQAGLADRGAAGAAHPTCPARRLRARSRSRPSRRRSKRQGVTTDDLIDFTPELRAKAIEVVKNFRIGPLFTPPSLLVQGGNQGTLGRPAPAAARTGRRARSIRTPACFTFRRGTHSASSGLEAPAADQEEQPALHRSAWRSESEYARRAAAVQAAVLAHDRHQHEHRRARLDGAARQRRQRPQQAGAEGPEPAAARRRQHARAARC